MNIMLFGANGAIGTHFLNRALGNGDSITAYVRRPDSISQKHQNLKVVAGDLSDNDLIEREITSADIVISTLGPALDMSRKKKGTPIADGHEIIMNAMSKTGKKRFITIGTPSIHAAEDGRNMTTLVPPFLARILYPNPFREMKKIEQLIKKSDLDWTVVRFINPNAKHKSNAYGVSLGDKSAKFPVSRENIAAFIYKVASEGIYLKQMPIVFNK